MSSPFPGMDPYLEQPVFWSEFHSRLIVAVANAIAPRLRPRYYVSVETRTYLDEAEGELLVGIPDAIVRSSQASRQTDSGGEPMRTSTTVSLQPRQVQLPTPIEIKERYLHVRETRSNLVIAVIEVLSPKNKRGGEGRESYLEKRQTILESQSHLIEIDLLRGYQPRPMTDATESAHYRILVSRSSQRPVADLYEFSLRDPIPDFLLPLKAEDSSLVVSLQTAVDEVYEQASYDIRVDYQQPVPPPALFEEHQLWINELLVSYR